MAAKVGLLDIHQKQSDQPRTYVKKCVADMLVRRLLAEPIRKGVVRLLAVRGTDEIPAQQHYIPETLPPVEIPGVKFIPPIRPEWTRTFDGSCTSSHA